MELQLKKLKVSASLSEETLAFTADVYLDGRLVGRAKNDGGGGMVLFHATESTAAAACQAFHAHLESLPPRIDDGLDLQPRCIEDAIEASAESTHQAQSVRAQIKRLMKNYTVFLTRDGELMSATSKGPAIEANVMRRHPGARLLNAIPIDEAVSLCLSLEQADAH